MKTTWKRGSTCSFSRIVYKSLSRNQLHWLHSFPGDHLLGRQPSRHRYGTNEQRLHSSAWSEHWTFNPGVGGSNPPGAIIRTRVRYHFVAQGPPRGTTSWHEDLHAGSLGVISLFRELEKEKRKFGYFDLKSKGL